MSMPSIAASSEVRTAAPVFSDSARAQDLAKNGFVHLKGVIPVDRIEEFRKLVLAPESTAANIHDTKVFEILLNELQVHKTVQSYFDEKLYYFGWSIIAPHEKPRYHHYHDDAKGVPFKMDEPKTTIFNAQARPFNRLRHPTWPVHRLFIYMDDHTDFSGGTQLRAGSHRKVELLSKHGLKALLKGKFGSIMLPGLGYVNPPIRPGDAVLFNLGAKHSGYFIRLRGPFSNFALPTAIDNFIKRILFASDFGRKIMSLIAKPYPVTRASVTMDFTTDSDWGRGYQVNRVLHPNNRKYQVQLFECNKLEFASRMEKAGLPVLPNPSLRTLENFLRD